MANLVVIDSNMLQSADLRDLLARTPDNYAVLPDFFWFEMYKQRSLAGVYVAFSVIRDFPDQLLVLESATHISALDPSLPDLIERMCREGAADDVRLMLQAIGRAEKGHRDPLEQLARQWDAAEFHMDDMITGAGEIVESLPEIAEIFTADEIRWIRTGGEFSQAMLDTIFGASDQIYETLIEPYAPAEGHLSSVHRYDAYLYRFALGLMIYALFWIRSGSQVPTRLDRTRNDIIDLSFAVYATYFSGLMTNDAKARVVHSELRTWLRGLGARVGKHA